MNNILLLHFWNVVVLIIIPVTVNGIEGQLYLARNPDESDSTITWIDPDKNIAFIEDAALDADSILHIAESVSLSKIEK